MSGAPRPTYTELLNVSFKALAEVVRLGYPPKMDLEDVHALAALNGELDENFYAYVKSAVQF